HLIVHRLVELKEGWARTRGDACRSSDWPVPAESLLGRVVEVRRGRLVFRAWGPARRRLGGLLGGGGAERAAERKPTTQPRLRRPDGRTRLGRSSGGSRTIRSRSACPVPSSPEIPRAPAS